MHIEPSAPPQQASQHSTESHEAWLNAKLTAVEQSTLPNLPHERVMTEMRALLSAKSEAYAD